MISKRSLSSLLISIVLPVLLLVSLARVSSAAERANTAPANEAKQRAAASYVKLPLSFEPNQGQSDPQVKFLSRGRGYALFLTGSEAVLSLRKPSGQPTHNRAPKPQSRQSQSKPSAPAVLRLDLVGANPGASVKGLEELPGKSNYFIGNDPKKWRTNVPTFAKVKYENIYPGVDLVYYGNPSADGGLEYDFVVAPGADPGRITLRVGAHRDAPLRIAPDGDLVVQAEGGEVRFQKPIVYQPMTDDPKPQAPNRKLLEGRYVLLADNQVGFEVPSYDKAKPLTIDPVLKYSTYLGGGGEAGASSVSVAVDAFGNAYVASGTSSTTFPVTAGAFQTTFGGPTPPVECSGGYICGDAVVAKINPTGSTLIYSTYLGGSGDDYAYGLAIDSAGNAYVSGVTNSPNFPTTAGAYQTGPQGGYDMFVTKLNPTGSALVYSTYLGGEYDEYVQALSIDSSGDAYVAGGSSSPNFPTTSGAYNPTFSPTKAAAMACGTIAAPEPCPYAAVAELNPTGTGLIYSTFLGGSGDDSAGGLAVDPSGAAYVTGWTSSLDFPVTASAFQSSLSAVPCGAPGPTWQCPNAFFTKLSPGGSALVYSTYLGGTGNEYPFSAALDPWNNAYIVGLTSSNNFPTTAGAFQTTHLGPSIAPGCFVWTGCSHAFVSKINPANFGPASLVYSTYLSGSLTDWGDGITVDSSGHAFVVGATTSPDFPTLYPIQAANAGGEDAYLTELNAAGSGLIFSTYLGGSGNDLGDSVALDPSGNVYVGGWTESGNFPVTAGVLQPTYAATTDLFVAALAAPAFTTAPQPVAPGVTVTYTYSNIINQTVSFPLGTSMGGAAYMAADFQQWNPTVFDTTRLPATSTNTWSGGTPVLPGTTCTPISGTGDNCIVIEDLCYAANGTPILPCQIFAPMDSVIGLTSMYQTQSSQPYPGLIIADDGQNDWANITTGFTDPTINGGSKGLNTDTAIVNLGVGIASPPNLEFGSVYLGTITVKSVTVTNPGPGPMTINDPFIWLLSGGDSKEFVALNLCPRWLAAGNSCSIDVAFFAGPDYALQTAILNVVDSGPDSPQAIRLSAMVINPRATLSSYNLNFGKEAVGGTSAPQTVTLTSTGATPLDLSTLTVSGNFAFDPSTTCTNGETLAPGASCAIAVTFKPTAKGPQWGSVVITDNAQNSPQSIWLSGIGD
jgi:hypothetical protein